MTLSTDDEGLAAEYALGTLDGTERATAAARRQREPQLDAAIGAWETRFALLMEAAPEREAPAGLLARIEARLGAASASGSGAVVDLTARLARWRAAAGGAGALAAALAAALAFAVVTRPNVPHQFVAVLQKSPDAPAFAMTVDIDRLEFSVRPVAAEAPAGKAYELWVIAPNQAPKSLGVLDASAGSGERKLSGAAGDLREATYAVTVEPPGGSPTGQPTSAPVFFGKLIPVGP